MKVGDMVMVRDAWIEADYMVPPGEILAIGYHENSSSPLAILLSFGEGRTHRFYHLALKMQ